MPEDAHTRYEDRGPLGAGGMGEVRRVYDRRLGVDVAMKILSPTRAADAEARARFLNEATITARLQHPGIVGVHDRGGAPDGRLWYTMAEVRGTTFAAHIAAAHADGPAPADGVRRLVEILRRVCEAMAYAHDQGVLHRDLKPDNLMVGPFGEVLVMDWGLAATLPVPGTSTIAGTPTYMAPEQARGAELDRSADVYALGVVLYELLTGGPPRSGSAREQWRELLLGPPVIFESGPPVDPGLERVCRDAMEWEREDRLPDAGALSAELGAWLDGARRRTVAERIVSEAMAQRPAIAALRAEAARQREAARVALAELRTFDPVALRAPAWAREDEAARFEREAAVAEVRWQQAIGSAFEQVPHLPAAHAALADHYAERLLDAEARGDVDGAARAETLLAAHDRGVHAALLDGHGAVTLVTDPPGAEVRLFRYVEEQRRLVARPEGGLGRTPLHAVKIPRGTWLFEVHLEGHVPVRYPVFLARGEVWQGRRPGTEGPFPIVLPAAGLLAPDDCYVPGGWAWSGGDPASLEPLPRRRLWVDPFVLKRHPVTNAEYLHFLNSLVDAGERARAEAAAPRQSRSHGANEDGQGVYSVDATGHFQLGVDARGRQWQADAPVVLVDLPGCLDYARWRAEREGVPWRLPNELEWEKAARGVDDRLTIWGRHLEPTWANINGSSSDPPAIAPVYAHPADESVYGVCGLTGNVRERCVNRWTHHGPAVVDGIVAVDPAAADDPDFRVTRGGSYAAAAPSCRPANRFGDYPHSRWWMLGFRLCRSAG